MPTPKDRHGDGGGPLRPPPDGAVGQSVALLETQAPGHFLWSGRSRSETRGRAATACACTGCPTTRPGEKANLAPGTRPPAPRPQRGRVFRGAPGITHHPHARRRRGCPSCRPGPTASSPTASAGPSASIATGAASTSTPISTSSSLMQPAPHPTRRVAPHPLGIAAAPSPSAATGNVDTRYHVLTPIACSHHR